MGAFPQIKFYIDLIAMILAIVTNSTLILLVITKSPQRLGNYRHLICYFSAISIVLALLHFLVQPYVMSEASFFIVMNLKNSHLQNHPTAALLLLSSVHGLFEVTIYAISINFIFRYFALQRQDLKEMYDLDIDKATYSGCFYYTIDEYGNKHWNWKELSGIFLNHFMKVIPLFIIFYFGTKSYKIIRGLISQGESEYSRRLQTQLYKALVAQTLIPLICLFLPIGVYSLSPLVGFSIEWAGLIFEGLLALYPAMDPIPIIFLYLISDASFFLVMNLKDGLFENYPTVALLLLDGLAGLFDTTIHAISISFVFRYFALQRQDLKNMYGLDIEKTTYSGGFYWTIDEYGDKIWNIKEASGIMVLNIKKLIPLFIIFYFGTKSYKIIRGLVSQGESEYSRRLQTQLYKALVAQTLIPLFFIFFPLAVYGMGPFIGLSIEWANLILGSFFTVYPALDPIPIIFLVDDYRNAFLNFFRRIFSKHQIAAVTFYDSNMNTFQA
ncbi:hypothetical protein GCK72_013206 [Caenorhabditis remanei]|uniref:Serpentine receptor class r-10 n=1 Tax=Caenorhabditis remanei TaxID=31234 RepID=A0A6A5GQU7_CAERE|nr:hypothetical protein GCK72_013206 [Caenorhabditis remanei]KAF1756752.1 hypothetical protein GCK72_013206 [Caenorhabditis remanei]